MEMMVSDYLAQEYIKAHLLCATLDIKCYIDKGEVSSMFLERVEEIERFINEKLS